MSAPETIKTVADLAVHSSDISFFSMIVSADLIGKSVMLLLVVASIWSWTIIITKIFQVRQVKSRIAKFEGVFWSGQVLDQLYEAIKRNVDNPLASVFVSAMNEFKRGVSAKSTELTSLKIGHKERIFQAMNLIKNREVEGLSKNLVFLATVGSSATFVGLFGTVWGIMHSFQSIASSKNTTLAVVAPGIAEALLATAIGLAAAIPAAAFYNYLSSQVGSVNNKIEDFMSELVSILSRAVDEERQ